MQGLRVKLLDIFAGVPKDILIPQWVYKGENNVISVLWLWFLSYPVWWFIINSTIFISGFLVHTIFCSFWRPVLESDWIYCELRTRSPPNAAWKWTSWAFLSCKICVENKNIDENSPNTAPWRGLGSENSRLQHRSLSSRRGLQLGYSVQRYPQLSSLPYGSYPLFESSNALYQSFHRRESRGWRTSTTFSTLHFSTND